MAFVCIADCRRPAPPEPAKGLATAADPTRPINPYALAYRGRPRRHHQFRNPAPAPGAPTTAPYPGGRNDRISRAEAARLNGAKSRGAAEGKARNACRHGMYAKDEILVGCDDPEAFDELRRQLPEHYVPEDPVQTTLVERIVVAAWRLRRILGAECCAVNSDLEPKSYDSSPARQRTFFSAAHDHLKITRYEAAIERSMYQAIHALRALQSKNAERTQE